MRHRLNRPGTLELWIDEAHDRFGENSGREVRDIPKTPKSLMQGEGADIVILTGEELLDRIVAVDPQVQRRFSKMRLERVTEATRGPVLWRLIEDDCWKVDIRPPGRCDLIGRLVHGGRGRFGRCIEGTVNAIGVALREGATTLGISHFAEGWAFQEGCEPGGNVFLSPRWMDLELDMDVGLPPVVRDHTT